MEIAKPTHRHLFLLLLACVIFGVAPTHAAAQLANATSPQDDASSILERFLSQEANILAELDRKNTKARRELLAWLRHDHAVTLARHYKTLKDETDLEKALAYSQSSTQLSPQTARFWKTYGLINLTANMGMISDIEAEGAFKRVLELDAKDTEARLMLIGLLLKDKEYEKAAGHYAVLFEQKPETVIANDLHRMNLTFISADIAGWGIEIYDTYLKEHPDDGKILVAKSILLKADGYDAQASRLLDETISSAKTAEAIKATARNLLAYWRDEQ